MEPKVWMVIEKSSSGTDYDVEDSHYTRITLSCYASLDQTKKELHNFNTQQSDDLHVPFAKYCKCRRPPSILRPKVYNKLPNEVKFCTSLKCFEEKVEVLLLNKSLYDNTEITWIELNQWRYHLALLRKGSDFVEFNCALPDPAISPTVS
nr:unnamed protein product [Callosobruchus analis]